MIAFHIWMERFLDATLHQLRLTTDGGERIFQFVRGE